MRCFLFAIAHLAENPPVVRRTDARAFAWSLSGALMTVPGLPAKNERLTDTTEDDVSMYNLGNS